MFNQLNNETVIPNFVSCGCNNTMVIDDKEKLWLAGFKINSEVYETGGPFVNFNDKENFTFVESAYGRAVAVSTEGILYWFGDYKFSKRLERLKNLEYPKLTLSLKITGKEVDQVKLSLNHAIILTKKFKLLSIGRLSWGKTGLIKPIDVSKICYLENLNYMNPRINKNILEDNKSETGLLKVVSKIQTKLQLSDINVDVQFMFQQDQQIKNDFDLKLDDVLISWEKNLSQLSHIKCYTRALARVDTNRKGLAKMEKSQEMQKLYFYEKNIQIYEKILGLLFLHPCYMEDFLKNRDVFDFEIINDIYKKIYTTNLRNFERFNSNLSTFCLNVFKNELEIITKLNFSFDIIQTKFYNAYKMIIRDIFKKKSFFGRLKIVVLRKYLDLLDDIKLLTNHFLEQLDPYSNIPKSNIIKGLGNLVGKIGNINPKKEDFDSADEEENPDDMIIINKKRKNSQKTKSNNIGFNIMNKGNFKKNKGPNSDEAPLNSNQIGLNFATMLTTPIKNKNGNCIIEMGELVVRVRNALDNNSEFSFDEFERYLKSNQRSIEDFLIMFYNTIFGIDGLLNSITSEFACIEDSIEEFTEELLNLNRGIYDLLKSETSCSENESRIFIIELFLREFFENYLFESFTRDYLPILCRKTLKIINFLFMSIIFEKKDIGFFDFFINNFYERHMKIIDEGFEKKNMTDSEKADKQEELLEEERRLKLFSNSINSIIKGPESMINANIRTFRSNLINTFELGVDYISLTVRDLSNLTKSIKKWKNCYISNYFGNNNKYFQDPMMVLASYLELDEQNFSNISILDQNIILQLRIDNKLIQPQETKISISTCPRCFKILPINFFSGKVQYYVKMFNQIGWACPVRHPIKNRDHIDLRKDQVNRKYKVEEQMFIKKRFYFNKPSSLKCTFVNPESNKQQGQEDLNSEDEEEGLNEPEEFSNCNEFIGRYELSLTSPFDRINFDYFKSETQNGIDFYYYVIPFVKLLQLIPKFSKKADLLELFYEIDPNFETNKNSYRDESEEDKNNDDFTPWSYFCLFKMLSRRLAIYEAIGDKPIEFDKKWKKLDPSLILDGEQAVYGKYQEIRNKIWIVNKHSKKNLQKNPGFSKNAENNINPKFEPYIIRKETKVNLQKTQEMSKFVYKGLKPKVKSFLNLEK